MSWFEGDGNDPGKYELIAKRKHIARKEYQCCMCRERIRKGEKYQLTVSKYDGEFAQSRQHINNCFLEG